MSERSEPLGVPCEESARHSCVVADEFRPHERAELNVPDVDVDGEVSGRESRSCVGRPCADGLRAKCANCARNEAGVPCDSLRESEDDLPPVFCVHPRWAEYFVFEAERFGGEVRQPLDSADSCADCALDSVNEAHDDVAASGQ